MLGDAAPTHSVSDANTPPGVERAPLAPQESAPFGYYPGNAALGSHQVSSLKAWQHQSNNTTAAASHCKRRSGGWDVAANVGFFALFRLFSFVNIVRPKKINSSTLQNNYAASFVSFSRFLLKLHSTYPEH